MARHGERKRLRGSDDSLSLEVIGGPIQTHDQIFSPRFQAKAARGSNQEVAHLINSGLDILGCRDDVHKRGQGEEKVQGEPRPAALCSSSHSTFAAPTERYHCLPIYGQAQGF